ncbi:pyrophosphate--fructose 6-phosphate 1-phosphotransferase [Clostridia bacterium]|nr:pyrophosphate--fructose 6-phosphate 1-phosphotransferase [Clostridia bacterium]
MSELKGACLIGQSGGPTSVINASTLGTIESAFQAESITRVFGAANGIRGVLDDRLYDLNKEELNELHYLKYTPSSALGSCRYKLKDPAVDDSDYQRILEVFKKRDIRYFFYNGGNDSMDTCNKISKFMLENNYECRVMGIPKTIDNDLTGTDHCPGYGSAAKYIATSCMEVYQDAHVYDIGMITILEIMGRHAGWLAASAALATYAGFGPDLIYLPETDFAMDRFLGDVKRIYKEKGKCIVAVSEGIHDKDGKFISEYGANSDVEQKDMFGHSQLGGLAAVLTAIVKKETGAKVRGIEFSLLQRAASHCASQTDIDEAYASGRAAVKFALAGQTDKMVAFERVHSTEYKIKIKAYDLHRVANAEKHVPLEWINSEGNGLEPAFIDYALPLIQGQTRQHIENGLPRLAKLNKILAE